jgi:hypothetical protein
LTDEEGSFENHHPDCRAESDPQGGEGIGDVLGVTIAHHGEYEQCLDIDDGGSTQDIVGLDEGVDGVSNGFENALGNTSSSGSNETHGVEDYWGWGGLGDEMGLRDDGQDGCNVGKVGIDQFLDDITFKT